MAAEVTVMQPRMVVGVFDDRVDAEEALRALKDAGPIATEYSFMGTPLLKLVKELTARPTIRSFQLRVD